MLNKKGSTLMELVISIVLISVVLIFLMRLLVDLNNTETNNSYAKENQIIRSEIIRTIENDFNASVLKEVNDQSDGEALKVKFTFNDNKTSSLEVLEKTVVYKNIEGKERRWSIKSGKIYPDKAGVSVLNYKGSGDDEGVFALEINIEVHTSNDLNKLNSNNVLDDITISYVGKYQKIEGNLTCLGVGCPSEKKIKIISSDKPGVQIVSLEPTYNSITVRVKGNSNNSEIEKYYYSIDGVNFNESSEAKYTFDNLLENASYEVTVYVKDKSGKTSKIDKQTVKTSSYNAPVVSLKSISSTSNSITINVNGTNGEGAITQYYYSIDNGNSYVSSSSLSYTFSNLASKTTYDVKVYAVDGNSRYSNVISEKVTTK